ncbi:hypothetical protein NFI96_014125, partial [Prochilodus magdalenae]
GAGTGARREDNMATRCRSAKCAAERRGARRELETWRHKLIACVGFESILEGIYGPRLLQDLSIFDDCEPEAVSDWSTDARCPFCNLRLEKLTQEQVPVSPPPAETPPPQGLTTSEKLQCQADQFLYAVFHKKEFPESCDPSIPLAAQELMRKMIRQFAIEYACKIQPEGPEGLNASQADISKHVDGVLDLSKKSTSSVKVLNPQNISGRPIREDYLDRTSEFAEGLLSKALKDIRSGSLDVYKAAILYGIPQKTLRLQAEALLPERKPRLPVGDNGGAPEVGWPTGETQLLLQKVAAWARSQTDHPEGARVAFSPVENAEFPTPVVSSYLHRLTLQRMVSQLRERNDVPTSHPGTPTPPQSPAAGVGVAIRIPQVRTGVQPKTPLDLAGLVDAVFQANKSSEGPVALHKLKTILPKQGVSECPSAPESRLLLQGDLPPLCMKNGAVGGSATGSGDVCGDDGERRDKQPRKKRGRYRQYDHDILEEAIAMVMGGKMSVSKAQGVYGVPHSTLEYKVKERMGTLKTPPKKKLRLSEAKTSGSIHSGTTTTNASMTAFKRFCSLVPLEADQCRIQEGKEEPEDWRGTVLEKVLSSLCSYHRLLLYCILQDMREHYSVALALRDAHRRMAKTEPYCCPAEGKSHSDHLTCSLGNCAAAGCAGCLTACGLRTCALPSVCICMKTLSGLTCQNLTLGCVGKVICPSSTVCCAHHKILVCQHQRNSENVCIAHASNVLSVHVKPSSILNCHKACRTCRSPSPPPLSPKPVDMECKTGDQTVSCKGQELTALSKPPPLLPHQTEAESYDKALQSGEFPTAPVKDDTEDDKHHCGSFLGVLMDTFTENLKDIQQHETEETQQMANVSQNSKACDDTHLTEIITTVFHSSTDKKYDLKELFEQRMTAEQRSPQTRSRRKQEVLAAMSKSPDLPASRRRSLQIKRDLARLNPSACRKKLGLHRSKCPKNGQAYHEPSEQSASPERLPEMEPENKLLGTQNSAKCRITSEKQSPQQGKSPADLPESPHCNGKNISQIDITDKKAIAKSQQDRTQMFQPTGKFERSRRNIVRPQRFSSYVTEPRKMFYAACFSESIFVKQSPSINSTTKHDSAEIIHTTTAKANGHSIKTEAEDHIMHPSSNTLTDSPTKKGCDDESSENPQSEQNPKTECHKDYTTPTKRLKSCGGKGLAESQSPGLIQDWSTNTDGQEDTKEYSLKYVSPIKLMLVSPVKDENGVKYTLKAADSGTNPHGQMFDPCVEASWAGNAINDQPLNKDLQTDSVGYVEFGGANVRLTKEGACTDQADLVNHGNDISEALPAVLEISPIKRRPGRPKKLGPQIEKAVKRPIGRPPKAKAGDPNSINDKTIVNQRTSEKSGEEDGNKNLKITIMYGRSRKTRRVVSEDMGHLSANQLANEVYKSGASIETNTGGDSVPKGAKNQLEDLKFVMPVEDKKGFIHSSSNIKCQKQSDLTATRKPGRPAKVKISGISVTVTTVSPRQRKIHMKRDLKDSPPQRRALLMESEPSKEMTISEHTAGALKDRVGIIKEGSENPRTSFVAVRHSVRERKPSIHLLHSVATARSLSRSNALVCRSRKLLMSKTHHQKHRGSVLAVNKTLAKKASKPSHMKNVVRFSGVSVDSIFASNERLKWWPITASHETLNEELARRIRLMSDTWVSDVLKANKSEESKTKQNPTCENVSDTGRSSAVKMLFERNYSMKKLCSWFMQTTETQSLAIVKKASARNPFEIFHYNSIRSACGEDVCPSSQAERLRKHVKKFAKVVPKSPRMHRQAQATVYKPRGTCAVRYLFNPTKVSLKRTGGRKIHRSCGSWGVYRTALLRAKSKFRTRAKKSLKNEVDHNNHSSRVDVHLETRDLSTERPTSENKVQNASNISESKEVEASEKTVGITGISKEERISSKAWSPETLKECRVFLKKINSPNTKSVTGECNICTVKFNVSPAGCDVSMEQKEQKTGETTKLEKTSSPPRKSLLAAMNQNKSGNKRRNSRTRESPPAKMTRQSRSSRGVLGARWCDFVLGPSK